MEEKEAVKSNARLVVSMLLTGKTFKSKELADAIAEAEKKKINPGTVSSILSRISNEEKCSFGCFVRKTKESNALVYSLVSEALALSEDQAYGLTLKKGKERYLIEQAVSDFPALHKYLPSQPADQTETNRKPLFRMVKKVAETVTPGPFIRVNSSSKPSSKQDHHIDVTIRYSSRYALSFSAALTTFILACCAVVLTIAACCLVAYMFFYPLLVILIIMAAVCGIGFFFWTVRNKRRIQHSVHKKAEKHL